MKNTPQSFNFSWRTVVLVVGLALIAYLLFFHNLGGLLPGYSAGEVQTHQNAASWQAIWHNPVNAPYKAVIRLVGMAGYHGLLATRLVSASFGVLAAFAFYGIIRRWYDFRTAFLTTILMITSAGFLHFARYGTGQIMQLAPLFIASTFMWYRYGRQPRRKLAGYALVALFALACYIPGMIWFELFGLVLLRRNARHRLSRLPLWRVASGVVLFLVLVAPLILASVRNPGILRTLSGLPVSWHTLSHFGSNLGQAILAIGVRGPNQPVLWLGHLPLLDVVELALAILGVYYYLRHEHSKVAAFICGMVLLYLVLVSLGGTVSFIGLVPFLYLLVASGLDDLLEQWLTVFPRNPVARFTGAFLICAMLFFSVLFQTRAYFIAWPHHTATRQVFSRHNPS